MEKEVLLMAFFGMYPSKYIGGNPYGFNGLYGFGAPSFFSSAHPSSINNGGVNYFSGNIQGLKTFKWQRQFKIAKI